MTTKEKEKGARGTVIVHADECKGCALCVNVCPTHDLQIAQGRLNRLGYHPVEFLDNGCTACGVCFYACPEPDALRVLRKGHPALVAARGNGKGEAS